MGKVAKLESNGVRQNFTRTIEDSQKKRGKRGQSSRSAEYFSSRAAR